MDDTKMAADAPEESRIPNQTARETSAAQKPQGVAPIKNTLGDPADEATIIEETIVRAPARTLESPSISIPIQKPPLPPPAPKTSVIFDDAPPAIKPLPPTPSSPPLPPPSLQSPPPAPPLASTRPPAPSPESQNILPQEPPHLSVDFGKEREAIARILEEAKLPERRSTPGAKRAASPIEIQPQQKIETSIHEQTIGETTPAPAVEENTGATPEKKLEEKENRSPGSITPLHTFKDDLREIVREKKISLIRAAALESDKKSRSNILAGEVVHSRSHYALRVIFAATVLLTLAGAALFGVYVTMVGRGGNVQENTWNAILFAESAVTFPLQNNAPLEIKRLLAQTRGGQNATLGSITQVIPTVSKANTEGVSIERPATLDEFFQALGTRAPPDLMRALSTEFFFGFHTVDENAPLFVIPVLSYERAFAGMLSWEQTMNGDLAPVFTAVPDQVIGTGGLPEKRRFGDIVMRNYDVRALKDDTDTIQLYYSFPNQHILVIGESPYSFNEVLSRLRADRKL